MKKIAIIGFGSRGRIFGILILQNPDVELLSKSLM